MLRNDYEGQNCSIARALEIVGERWTLLIIRDAFLGLRRFDQFQENLGIARNVLTDRLNRLVEEGILDRVRYNERPERYEYRLTPKGRDLAVTLAGLRQWGDKYLSETAAPDHPPQIGQATRNRGVRAEGRRCPSALTRLEISSRSRPEDKLRASRLDATAPALTAVTKPGERARPKAGFLRCTESSMTNTHATTNAESNRSRRSRPPPGQSCASPGPRPSAVVIGDTGRPPLAGLRESPVRLLPA